MKYRITLSTIASVTAEVDADSEDAALDQAYSAATEFSNQLHRGVNWTADLNGEWQYGEPEIEELEGQ